MPDLIPAAMAAMAAQGAPRRALTIRVATVPEPSVFWTGIGPLTLPGDSDFDPGVTYRGAGIMKTLPSLRMVTDGKAERVDFEWLNHPAVIAMLGAGVTDVDLNIGYVFFEDDWSLVSAPAWLWQGVCDPPRTVQKGGSKRFVIGATSGALDRKRAGRRYWTNASHQSRHPGDTICAGMSLMNGHAQDRWP